jgi:hypothetical protein
MFTISFQRQVMHTAHIQTNISNGVNPVQTKCWPGIKIFVRGGIDPPRLQEQLPVADTRVEARRGRHRAEFDAEFHITSRQNHITRRPVSVALVFHHNTAPFPPALAKVTNFVFLYFVENAVP